MRLYRSQIPRIASDIIQTLRADHDIEVEDVNVPEAEKDAIAVMDQYLKTDQRIVEQAKDIVDARRLTHSELGKIKRELCERYEHPTGDEGIRWIVAQIVESFMISNHIDEVYADDQMLRRKLYELFKRHMVDEAQMDREVRERIKNLQEGTSAWQIQYQKVMREIRRKHGIS
jgi:hypothetical protein